MATDDQGVVAAKIPLILTFSPQGEKGDKIEPLSPTGGEDKGEGAFMPMGVPQAHEVLRGSDIGR